MELDGAQHQQRHRYDERRDRRIEAQGYRVLRFWDNQVFQETEAVLEVILDALKSIRPHPARGRRSSACPQFGEVRPGSGQ